MVDVWLGSKYAPDLYSLYTNSFLTSKPDENESTHSLGNT